MKNCGFFSTTRFYSYEPDLWLNILFLVLFMLLVLATVLLRRHNQTLMFLVLLGTANSLQVLTFVGRVLLRHAGDSRAYFLTFMISTILAPTVAEWAIFTAMSEKITAHSMHGYLSKLATGVTAMKGLSVASFGLEVAGIVLLGSSQSFINVSKLQRFMFITKP